MNNNIFPETNLDHIIFDWDGTLVDSVPSIILAHSYVFEKMGLDRWSSEDAEKFMKFSSRELYPKIFLEDADKAFAYLDSYLNRGSMDGVKIFDGAYDILNSFMKKKIRMSVVSNKKHNFLLKEIEYFKVSNFFNSIIGSSALEFDKPSAKFKDYYIDDGLISNKSDVLVVGDTETDYELALRCGFKFMPIGDSLWINEYRLNIVDGNLYYGGFNNIVEFNNYISKFYNE